MERDSKYSKITPENFPPKIEVRFVDGEKTQTLVFSKVTWEKLDVESSLRYGNNPGQPAAMYRLSEGGVMIGDFSNIQPGRTLASQPEILQTGKMIGKINLTDADRAMGLLSSLMDTPSVAIIKHGNPSGVAIGNTLEDAYLRAVDCDRVASYGGCVGLNRTVDTATAQAIVEADTDVVVAPDYETGAMEFFAKRETLRVLRVQNIENLKWFATQSSLDFKSLQDGGLVVQWGKIPQSFTEGDLRPASSVSGGSMVRSNREVRKSDRADMIFAWKVVSAMSSNAVVFVKDGVTVGIATGQQDSLTAAEVARDKAYRNLADRIALKRFGKLISTIDDRRMAENIRSDVEELKGGLIGSTMASDAFFPYADCVQVGIDEHAIGVIQPGGSKNDHLVIEACNAAGVPMVFTGQRSFVD